MKRSLVVLALLVVACGLRTIPSPDGGGGGLAGGSTAGGSEAGGSAGGEAGGSTAGGASAGGAAGGSSSDGGCATPQDCTAPANATPACDNGTCSFVCTTPRLKCGGACCAARSITAGDRHTCVTTDQGALLCWGGMFVIGNGGSAGSAWPTVVANLSEGVAEAAAGNVNTCARTMTGGVKCWGAGPTGSGVLGFAASPVQVANLGQGATSLSSGLNHVCAVVDGGVKCWGNDSHGEQGCNQQCTGANRQQLSPGDVTGLVYDVKQVSCGGAHCCAVLNDAGVRCWGFNIAGECGDGAQFMQRNVPVVATAFDAGADEVYAGYASTCARSGTTVRCLGSNGDGELGAGLTAGSRVYAVPVLLGPGLTAFATSAVAHHACAVVDAGVWCWGQNTRGQLGDGMMMSRNVPVRVLGLSEPMVDVAVGLEHTCALSEAGGVWCWGSNFEGQLGTGTMGGTQLAPVLVR